MRKPCTPGFKIPYTGVLLGWQLELLEQHIGYRSCHCGDSLALVDWDLTIAERAQKYAETCPEDHSKPGTEMRAEGHGENLAMGYNTPAAAVSAWYNEIKDYDFESPVWQDCNGHFVQVVHEVRPRISLPIFSAEPMHSQACTAPVVCSPSVPSAVASQTALTRTTPTARI